MTHFEQVEPGKYAATVTLTSGQTRRILVRKEDEMNPSARGSAYRTVWRAYNGGMNLSVKAETRQAAFDAAVKILRARGTMPPPT